MRKNHQFRPEGLDLLEDRVVMNATGGVASLLNANHYVLPTLTSRTLNTSLSRIDRAFQTAMGNYQRAFQAAQRMAVTQGEGVAVARLAQVADRIGAQLANQLNSAPYGIPYGARNISPSMRDIGNFVRYDLTGVSSLAEARTTGVDIFRPAWTAARETLVGIVRSDIASGLYNWK